MSVKVKVKKAEAREIVERVYQRVLYRKPDRRAVTWEKMIQLGVFTEQGLARVFRLTLEYRNMLDGFGK